jgi:hypothetical protein
VDLESIGSPSREVRDSSTPHEVPVTPGLLLVARISRLHCAAK